MSDGSADPDPIDAVAALGIKRELAAFHLDRLVEAGLLQTEYRRLSGRTGPGAGRPAKLYRRTDAEIGVSFPARRYAWVADVMATALGRLSDASGIESLATIARERGRAVGLEALRALGRRPGRVRSLSGLVDVLRGAGYEPRLEPDGTVCLRNCPYSALTADHRELTCGMNLAWAQGVVAGLGVEDVSTTLAPEAGRCCVVFDATSQKAVRRNGATTA